MCSSSLKSLFLFVLRLRAFSRAVMSLVCLSRASSLAVLSLVCLRRSSSSALVSLVCLRLASSRAIVSLCVTSSCIFLSHLCVTRLHIHLSFHSFLLFLLSFSPLFSSSLFSSSFLSSDLGFNTVRLGSTSSSSSYGSSSSSWS